MGNRALLELLSLAVGIPVGLALIAEMVKLVDTPASGAGGGNPVEVRVLFSAPSAGFLASRFRLTKAQA